MSRPPKPKSLRDKLAEAFDAVGKIPRAGKNAKYPYTKATDVFAAVRHELFKRGVSIAWDEQAPEYVPVSQSNGGEQITECRLHVKYGFADASGETELRGVNGVGRDAEDKALYKAQTGAQKAMLKRFGLMAEETDDPEWDASQASSETLDQVAPPRMPAKSKPVREFEIHAFEEACVTTGKTQQEVSDYLLTAHKISTLAEMKRGEFKAALRWASNGGGTLSPKPQAVPDQGNLPLGRPANPISMKIGSQAIEFQPKDGTTYSV